MKMNDYKILENNDKYILIKDSGTGTTITNSAEQVLADIYSKRLLKFNETLIFYIDTLGRVDEIVHEKDKFIGFETGYDSIDLFNIGYRSNNDIYSKAEFMAESRGGII